MFMQIRRLKQTLGLPKIQSRPPCPPRVYQKLYRHLDSALAAGARRTPRAPKAVEPTTPNRTPTVTPRKSRVTTSRTPASARHKRKRESAISSDVPTWVMPAIRGLCKRLEAPAAPPHVFAGVSSILTLPPPVQDGLDDIQLERLQSLSVEALVVAVYILVRTRLLGVQTDPKGYSAQRDDAARVMNGLRNDEEPSGLRDSASVDTWMREINRGRWTEMDWFENIGEGAGLAVDKVGATTGDSSDKDDVDEEDSFLVGRQRSDRYKAEKPFLQPGLGTMVSLQFHVVDDC